MSTRALSHAELSSFTAQLAMILRAGISPTEGVAILLEDAADGADREILSQLHERLLSGDRLHKALEASGLFPAYLLHMVELGEESGSLDSVMEGLSDHYAREEALRRSVRSALVYPAVMVGMMLAVILVLLLKVMPVFRQVLLQLGSDVSGLSGFLYRLSADLQRYGALLISLLALLVLLGLYLGFSRRGRALLLRLGAALGFSRGILEKTALCRFAGALAITLRSGLNPERSMELLAALDKSPLFAEKLSRCRQAMEEGQALSRALYQAGFLSGMDYRLVLLGEHSGELDRALEKVARDSQDEVDRRLSRILAVIEPALVVFLSLVVGMILLSVMFPLLGILSGM